jgi:hypothetical protein
LIPSRAAIDRIPWGWFFACHPDAFAPSPVRGASSRQRSSEAASIEQPSTDQASTDQPSTDQASIERASIERATVDVATRNRAEPAAGALDHDSSSGAGRPDAVQWPGATDDVPIADPGSHPAHAAETTERADWAWVEEWRAGNEPTPWATGLVLTVFSALVVGVAVWVLAAGLADRPVVAVLVNLLVAGGLAPAIWLSRGLPVLRWMGAGAAVGIVIGWIAALLMLPLPAP